MLAYHSHTHLIINDLQHFSVADRDKNLRVPGRVAYKRKPQRSEVLLHAGIPAGEEFPGSEHKTLRSHISWFSGEE